MTADFIKQLPSDLVTHVVAICGREGEDWLKKLPSLIRTLEDRWSVSVREPFPGGEFNFVAPAVCDDRSLAVLKISPPLKNNEIFGEAKHLKTLGGLGAVKLLLEDLDLRAILIEQAVPGKSLTECFKDREPEAVAPAIEVLRSILRPPPDNFTNITLLDNWFEGLRRYSNTGFHEDYALKALKLYEELSNEPHRIHFLHGDFHPGNVVSAERSPFLAIDPKGVVGHIGYEIAVFLNNLHWWQERKPDITSRLEVAVRQFSDAFDISTLELRQWAFAQMVLGAWWTFDEMPDIYKNEVAKADIWNV